MRWRSFVPCLLLGAILCTVAVNLVTFVLRQRLATPRRPLTSRRRANYERVADESEAVTATDETNPNVAARRECLMLHSVHDVVVGVSWGSLTEDGIARWKLLFCDQFVNEQAPRAERALDDSAPTTPVSASVSNELWSWLRGAAASTAARARAPVSSTERCSALRRAYPDMLPGTSWGAMPENERVQWEYLDCTNVEPSLVAEKAAEAAYVAQYERTLERAIAARPSRLRKREGGASGKPVVAIGISTTTRTLRVRDLSDLSLFRIMLPSLARTAEARFEYWVYLAHDIGDAFFDSAESNRAVVAWVGEQVVTPLAARGVDASVLLLRFNNTVHKPGPVFNFMMAAAAQDGADYLYRINDDTELEGADWTSRAVEQLVALSHVGVVGPICYEGNVNILTHDFVHRTHLEIFQTYYPPVFSDWYMDDWITKVYGQRRTRRGPFRVTHHVGQHATRYAVDRGHEAALVLELARGFRRIADWCAARASRCVEPTGGWVGAVQAAPAAALSAPTPSAGDEAETADSEYDAAAGLDGDDNVLPHDDEDARQPEDEGDPEATEDLEAVGEVRADASSDTADAVEALE
jgi:hypothetical protein